MILGRHSKLFSSSFFPHIQISNLLKIIIIAIVSFSQNYHYYYHYLFFSKLLLGFSRDSFACPLHIFTANIFFKLKICFILDQLLDAFPYIWISFSGNMTANTWEVLIKRDHIFVLKLPFLPGCTWWQPCCCSSPSSPWRWPQQKGNTLITTTPSSPASS